MADLNHDGHLEYILGRRDSTLFRYRSEAPDRWTRHILGENSASSVGMCVLNVAGHGWLDVVTSDAWYGKSVGGSDGCAGSLELPAGPGRVGRASPFPAWSAT